MPFTPYHFGPSLMVGSVLPNLPLLGLFIATNVLIDIEPLIVIFLDLNYPLHGFFHSLLGSTLLALIISAFIEMFLKKHLSWKEVFTTVFFGLWFHIGIDSIMHSDIKPLWPLSFNPLYQLMDVATLYRLCLGAFLPGLILAIFKTYRLHKK